MSEKSVRDSGDACPRCTGWRRSQQTNECHPLCESAHARAAPRPEPAPTLVSVTVISVCPTCRRPK